MSSCRWNGSRQPRTVPGRHGEDCVGDSCTGCLPCAEGHCRVCGLIHADGTCPECIASTRDDLRQLARMCGELPEEVEHRGSDGEAMILLAPAADPEAIGHVQASIAAGRLPADYLDHADNDLHPLFVTATWDMVWREALEHGEPTSRLTLATAVDYLDRQLTYMAGFEHVPFEDFARDVRQSRAHLEAVLHDGEQVEMTRVPCTVEHCLSQPRLVIVRGLSEKEDHYECPSCKASYQQGEYARAKLRLLVSTGADRHVRMQDARDAIDRPERTWRKWIRFGHVRSYRDVRTGQVWVWWPDVREAETSAPRRQRIA